MSRKNLVNQFRTRESKTISSLVTPTGYAQHAVSSERKANER